MTVQTEYLDGIVKALPGLPFDLSDHEAISRTAEVSAIAFGLAVVRGSSDYEARLPDVANLLGAGASGTIFQGVVMREHIREDIPEAPLAPPLGDSQTSYVKEQGTLAIKTAGRIWVRVETAVTEGDDVFFRHTQTGGTDVLGSFRNDNAAGNATQVATARFHTSAAAGELAVIELKAAK